MREISCKSAPEYRAETAEEARAGLGISSDAGRTENQEKRFSVSETVDGRFVAVVDNDILADIDTDNWNKETKKAAKKAAKEALAQFKDGIAVNGIEYKVNRTTKDEYTRSEYTERLYRKGKYTVFSDKMRFADVADDVIFATVNLSSDGVLVHERNDNFVDFEHGEVLLKANSNEYSASVVVGVKNNGDYVLYDIVNIVPTSFKIKEAESSPTPKQNNAEDYPDSASANSILENRRVVKSISEKSEKNFSVSDEVRGDTVDGNSSNSDELTDEYRTPTDDVAEHENTQEALREKRTGGRFAGFEYVTDALAAIREHMLTREEEREVAELMLMPEVDGQQVIPYRTWLEVESLHPYQRRSDGKMMIPAGIALPIAEKDGVWLHMWDNTVIGKIKNPPMLRGI